MGRKLGVVIGLGETGAPLLHVLSKAYGMEVYGYDTKGGAGTDLIPADYLNICIPYNEHFMAIVRKYQKLLKPKLTIIHSTVPIGTTLKIGNSVHSPINGRHNDMTRALYKFPKWIGGHKAEKAVKFFEDAGLTVNTVETSSETEFLKLSCLGKYGVSLAYAQYQQHLCNIYGFSYGNVLEWDTNYNTYVDDSQLKRPLLLPPGKKIGGHCVIPVTKMLNEQHSSALLREVLKYE